MVYENRVLWRTFGPKKDEVTEGCRKLHDAKRFIICTVHS
jgi:hypothetical protein